MTALFPVLALSVRQPWAWAIVYAGKDIENRTARAISFMSPLAGRRAIHAAQLMTQAEYAHCAGFLAALGIACPPPAELQRGGIIGSVDVLGVVKTSASPWFFGPRGLVLANPEPCPFIPSIGALGYFAWRPADLTKRRVTTPRWMTAADPAGARRDLFGGAS